MPLQRAEDEVARGRLGEVTPKLVDKELRNRQLAAAGHRLGRLDIFGGGSPDLFKRADDLDGSVEQVQPCPLERGELAPPAP